MMTMIKILLADSSGTIDPQLSVKNNSFDLGV